MSTLFFVVPPSAILFNLQLPHINEPLGTNQKCRKMLEQAGFIKIEVKTDVAGKFIRPEDQVMGIKRGFYPRGNPLSQISSSQLAQLEAEYRAEIERLATSRGIWCDQTTFFVRAEKTVSIDAKCF